MNKKQKLLADYILDAFKKDYNRVLQENEMYGTETYDVKAYQTAKELLDFPFFGGSLMGNAAYKVGYSHSTIDDIHRMGKHCCRLMDTIEPYVMSEWSKYLNND